MKTKIVKIGNVKCGGGNPVVIKSMLKNSPKQFPALLREAKSLEKEGAQAIRMAVKEKNDISAFKKLKEKVKVPFVADIHFDYKMALAAIAAGFSAIRLNPLNLYAKNKVKQVIKEAKKAGISVRVGVNSGGLKENFKNDTALARRMVKAAYDYIKILEKENFFDIMVSLKASTVNATILANEFFSAKFPYPLHLGVTASGPFLEGVVKSSLGIGYLLRKGIGDLVRVSLTGSSYLEVRVAKYILQGLGRNKFYPEIISCPTCSRCSVDLIKMVDKFKKITEKNKEGINFPSKIAVMGCIVNGPGEAYQADIGIAFGNKKGAIFKKDKILKRVGAEKALEEFVQKIGEIYGYKRT